MQNNLTYINEGNIDLFGQEAEQRHSQIMEQMVQQLCQDYETRSLNVEQMCFTYNPIFSRGEGQGIRGQGFPRYASYSGIFDTDVFKGT